MYNAERTITVPLSSLARQALPPGSFELVLVDDGSTDRSASKARKLLETAPFRWTILEGPRGGVSAARNKGIDHAQGDHVFFLDADDSLPADFLETVLAGIEKEGADLAWIWKITNPAEFPALRKHAMALKRSGLACLEAYLKIPRNAQVMVRRSFLGSSRVRYTEGLTYGEDFDYFVRLLLEARRVHVEDRTFYLYRRHPFQVTRTIDRVEARKATDEAFRRLSGFLAEKGAPPEIVLEMKRHEARARINLLRAAWKRRPEGYFDELLESPETDEAIRFAGQGKLSVKWQMRAAMLDLARMVKF
jgi:glycosyltransferase involved in cell wall biosynthesis